MANSRSNIYPVQLQGAELNLNKYDAEIKQYSGFNKNNSPFVGGCLSNVFTKEQQIEGGNADNVYIDANGDVYRVDTEGLYRNETKIISYPSLTKFYQKRKAKVNAANIVKVLNDDVYITKENNILFPANSFEGKTEPYYASGYIAHWGNGYSCILGEEESILPSFIDIVSNGTVCVFSYKRYYHKPSDDVYTNIGLVYYLIIPNLEQERSIYLKPSSTGNFGYFFLNDVYTPYRCSQTAWIKSNSQIILAINEELDSASTSTPTVAKVVLSQNSYTKYDFTYFANEEIISGSPHYELLPSRYFKDWYMTNNGLFYYKKTSTQKKSFNLSVYPSNTYYDISLVIYFTFSVNTAPLTYTVIYRGQDRTNASGSTPTAYADVWFDRMKGVFTPYYVFFAAYMHFGSYGSASVSTYNKFLAYSLCNTLENVEMSFSPLTYNDDENKLNEINTGGVAFCDDFKILINNNNLSGISVADFYINEHIPEHRENESFNGVLIEEWNSIEDFSIFDHKLFYKKGGTYYCIEQSTPKLKKVLNQIVSNCNYQQNSYDTLRDKVLHFAPDWNCSYLDNRPNHVPGTSTKNVATNIQVNASTTFQDLYFVASAINEYNLENNSSLILNMVSCCFSLEEKKYYGVVYNHTYSAPTPITRTAYRAPYDFVVNYIETGAPNFYESLMSENQAIYKGTPTKDGLVNKELEGLSFPNDTNGNVQYSPSLFSEYIQSFGTEVFVKEGSSAYQLIKSNSVPVLAYYLGTLVENLANVFIIQGQYYGIVDDKIFSISYSGGVVNTQLYVVSVKGLQFVGNTPYEALFFSKTNRCLYSFTGANVLTQRQLVDKISEVRNYLYNPATQTVFLITDIGVLFYGLFGQFLLEYTNITNIFLLNNGIVLSDNNGNYRYIKYYLDEDDTDYTKENIRLETCFYGMNNQTVTINDCLYFRIFSEEHEEGDLKVSATTISLSGRKTEDTTFKIKASDWDAITHTIYLRYQPKEQRGLGVSFSIDSPFKIASLSVGSQADAILVDKVSKGAINAPQITSNNAEW